MKLASETRRKAVRGALVLAGVLSLAVLTSCEDDLTGPSDLSGTWRLESLRLSDGSEIVPPDAARFTLEFEANGEVAVFADCNGCGGRYAVDDDMVDISNLACTLIACPTAPLDTQYVGILDGESDVDIDDDELTLSSSRGTALFRR